MICALTGERAKDPVITPTGTCYDREAILKHLKQSGGKDPETDEQLSVEDLISIRLSNPDAVPSRQLTAASVPSLLQTFQTEYDALVLESFALKREIEATRKELAKTLYSNDAAARVIARLMKEKEGAQQELEQLRANIAKAGVKSETGPANSGLPGLDQEDKTKINNKSTDLSAQRKQRTQSEHLATPADFAQFKPIASHAPHLAARPGILSLDLHPNQELTVTGGVDRSAIVFDRKTAKKVASLSGHSKRVTETLFHPTAEIVVTGSSDTTVRIWKAADDTRSEYQVVHTISLHSAEIVRCSMHATGEYLASASRDRTWAFHSLNSGAPLLQVLEPDNSPLTCAMLHPDGLLLGTGADNSLVQLWDLKSQKNACTFKGHKGEITDLCFSENGFYLATAAKDNTIKLWDLRGPTIINTLKLDTSVKRLHYDYSGKYLAVAAGNEIRLFTGKQLEFVHTFSDHTASVTDVKFGRDALFLVSASMDRTLKFWG